MSDIETQICSRCDEDKELSEYYADNRNNRRWLYCRSCASINRKQRYAENPEKEKRGQRNYHLRINYGLTPDQYADILKSQNDSCKVCYSKDALMGGGKFARFAIDHDHSCCNEPPICGKCIRGLLCHPCNRLLGQAKDDPDILTKAAEYLLSYNSTKN